MPVKKRNFSRKTKYSFAYCSYQPFVFISPQSKNSQIPCSNKNITIFLQITGCFNLFSLFFFDFG